MNLLLLCSMVLIFILLVQLNKAKKKIKAQENIINNRDIPEIIKIEEEKWKLQKEKEQAKLAGQVKNGEYSLQLSLKTLEQVTRGLKKDKLTLHIQHPNIEISDGYRMWTIKPSITNKKPSKAMHASLSAFDTAIMKRVDKKEFINALKVIATPFAEIIFYDNSSEITIKQPRNGTFVTMQSKN